MRHYKEPISNKKSKLINSFLLFLFLFHYFVLFWKKIELNYLSCQRCTSTSSALCLILISTEVFNSTVECLSPTITTQSPFGKFIIDGTNYMAKFNVFFDISTWGTKRIKNIFGYSSSFYSKRSSKLSTRKQAGLKLQNSVLVLFERWSNFTTKICSEETTSKWFIIIYDRLQNYTRSIFVWFGARFWDTSP